MSFRTLSAAALTLALASVSQAALAPLYSTNFNSPTYSDGVLNSGADTTTPGQDGWLTTSGGSTNAIAVSNTATNGIVTLTNTGQDVRHLFTPTVAAPASGTNSVYLQADINVASITGSTGDYFIHLGDGSTSLFYARTYIRASGGGYQLAVGSSSGAATFGSTVLDLNTNYTILVRFDLNSGTANDSGALFVNPTTEDGSGNTPYVAVTTVGTDPTNPISSVSLRQGSSSNLTALSMTVDNIVVSAVPEPTTIAAGLAAMGLIGRRRRA